MRFRDLFDRPAPKTDRRSGARVVAEWLRDLERSPPPRIRTGVRRWRRHVKPARDNFLTALSHVKMRDWDALRAKAAALSGFEKASRAALRLVLRRERGAAKNARRLARAVSP